MTVLIMGTSAPSSGNRWNSDFRAGTAVRSSSPQGFPLNTSRSTEPAPIRLTRRGRLVLVGLPTVLFVALVMMLGVSLTSQAKAAGNVPAPTETISISVGQGETLWGIAGEFAPDRDPREFVAELVELNGLGSSVVQAGQSLAVPVGG
ncbi:LysM peptidoglycan-binding domain-containing protein [Arthrobacter sp. H41]|uniref:LysM peptidoglycan-binding domain-containing protein n=1 Tax=Arthrobacter sp. H41 TaxID=1312978 RepID=UPI0020A6BFFF|nr:LysM peptidoglycan-binding domain-containing protein [Arthrobacter sp. H41]